MADIPIKDLMPQEVVVPYADLDKDAQFHFRRGMHVSGHLGVSDAFLHAYLMEIGLLRIAGFRTFMLQSFSQPFTYGYCYGAELGVGQKRHIQELEKNHG
nr:MAG TPA: hypothetical protein [Caudoviricetes sp.]